MFFVYVKISRVYDKVWRCGYKIFILKTYHLPILRIVDYLFPDSLISYTASDGSRLHYKEMIYGNHHTLSFLGGIILYQEMVPGWFRAETMISNCTLRCFFITSTVVSNCSKRPGFPGFYAPKTLSVNIQMVANPTLLQKITRKLFFQQNYM